MPCFPATIGRHLVVEENGVHRHYVCDAFCFRGYAVRTWTDTEEVPALRDVSAEGWADIERRGCVVQPPVENLSTSRGAPHDL
jgi:hypothetical protein